MLHNALKTRKSRSKPIKLSHIPIHKKTVPIINTKKRLTPCIKNSRQFTTVRSGLVSTAFSSTSVTKTNIPTSSTTEMNHQIKTDKIKADLSFNRPKLNPHIPRILILGGGAAGLALATRLGRTLGKKQTAEILLVSSTLAHIWKPLLHEAAVGSLNTYEDELNYFGHGAKNNFFFHLGEMHRIEPSTKRVYLSPLYRQTDISAQLERHQISQEQADHELLAPERFIDYDYLVVAIGSKGNDFNTKGAKQNCIFLDSRAEADRFQRELMNCYLKAQGRNVALHHGDALSKPLSNEVSIVAVGGGLTGVELVSELSFVVNNIASYGLNSINPDDVKISLIEAGPRILPALDEDLSLEVHEKLTQLGINILTGTKVVQVDPEQMICERDGKKIVIKSTLSAWCAGIKADEALQTAGLEINRINQLVVNSSLQTTRDPYIFCIGDAGAYTPEGASRPIPATAQAAHQQAQYLAKHLPLIMSQSTATIPPFEYHDKGVLISVAKTAVGRIFGQFPVRSYVAGLMYYLMYRFHQAELHGVWKTTVWIWRDILTHMNGRPQIKLH